MSKLPITKGPHFYVEFPKSAQLEKELVRDYDARVIEQDATVVGNKFERFLHLGTNSFALSHGVSQIVANGRYILVLVPKPKEKPFKGITENLIP